MTGQITTAPRQIRSKAWLLRFALPLVMLLQAAYAVGWAYISLMGPTDPESVDQHTTIGASLFTALVTVPGPLLVCSAVVLVVTAGRSRERFGIGLTVVAQVIALISGVVSGGLLLSVGAVVVLGLLAVSVAGRNR